MQRALLPASVKKLTLIAAAAAALSPCTPASAQRAAPVSKWTSELDQYIAAVLTQWQIPGIAVAVVRNDSVVVAKGYGVRELGKRDRVDANTVFDVASLSKSFTATAAAVLVDRGILRWDDPVRRYLPDLVLPGDSLTERATLRDFLSHRTGLDPANMMWVPTAVDRKEVLRRMRYLRPIAPFRQTMVYSNIGYSVAGEAMAAAAHTDFESLLRDAVIRRLGLRSTTWSYAQAGSMPNVAASHATVDGRQQVVPRELQRQSIAPAAAVQTSASDMTRWLRLHLNNGVLDGKRYVSDSSMSELHSVSSRIPTTPAMRAARLVQDTVIGYGMGWQIMDYRGHRVWWHTGNGDGQIAYMALFPGDRLGIAVMVNTWSAPLVHGALVNRIADAFLGYPPRDWAAEAFARVGQADSARAANRRAMVLMRSTTPPRLPLDAFTGKYEHPVFGPVWIRMAGANLSLQMGEGRIADLEYHGDDNFYVLWRDPFFREYYGTHVKFEISGDSVLSFTTTLNRDQFTARKADGATPNEPQNGGVAASPASSGQTAPRPHRARSFSNQLGAFGSITFTSTEPMSAVPVMRTSGASGNLVPSASRRTSKLPITGSTSHSIRSSGGTRTVTLPMMHLISMCDVPAPICARVRSTSAFPHSANARNRRGSVQSPSRLTWERNATVPRRSGTSASATTTGCTPGGLVGGGKLEEVTIRVNEEVMTGCR